MASTRFEKIGGAAIDLIGTSASPTTVAGGATSTSTAVDVGAYSKIAFHIKATYGASVPDSDPELLVLGSVDETNFDSVNTTDCLAIKQITRNVNDSRETTFVVEVSALKAIKFSIINGATNSADFWVAYQLSAT
jgi:hypothetical protein